MVSSTATNPETSNCLQGSRVEDSGRLAGYEEAYERSHEPIVTRGGSQGDPQLGHATDSLARDHAAIRHHGR